MMGFKQWSVAAAAALAVTALSAVVELTTGTDGTDWSAFVRGTARTAVIVFVVALMVELVRARRNRPAIRAPAVTESPSATVLDKEIVRPEPLHCGMIGHHHTDPGYDSWAEIIGDEINEIGALTDHVFAMKSLADHEAELDDIFVRIDDLRWLLANYVIRGGRVRRLVSLPRLIAAGSGDEQTAELRRSATALLHAIRNTNTHVADWLLAHRVAIPNPDLLDTNALLDRHLTMAIDPMTVSADPLYLLTCHIHDLLEVAESLDDLEHPVLQTLENGLVRPLDAIDHELNATMAFNAAVLSMTRSARSEAA